MKKERVIQFLQRTNDKLGKLVVKDVVKRVGDSGYVALPKELIGKYVELKLEVLG
jgi:putative transposon-encoded protein